MAGRTVPRYEDYFNPDGTQKRRPSATPSLRRRVESGARDLLIGLSALPAGRAISGAGMSARAGASLMRSTAPGVAARAPAANPVLRGAYEVVPDVARDVGAQQALLAQNALNAGNLLSRVAATREGRKVETRSQRKREKP